MCGGGERLALSRVLLPHINRVVSRIGVGGWLGQGAGISASFPEKQKEAAQTLRAAIAAGINYFDTSPAYFNEEAEKLLGASLGELTSDERRELVISTKVGTHPRRPGYSAADVQWSFENSQRVLGQERFDVVYIHDPDREEDMRQILGPGGALEALERYREEGRIGAIGLGVRKHLLLNLGLSSGRLQAILTPYDYDPVCYAGEPIIYAAKAEGFIVVNGSPYHAGLLAGLHPRIAHDRRPVFEEDLGRAEAIWAWCQERGRDVGVLSMQFSLRNPWIDTVLVGCRSVEELRENIRHANASIDGQQCSEFEVFCRGLPPLAGGGDEDAPRL